MRPADPRCTGRRVRRCQDPSHSRQTGQGGTRTVEMATCVTAPSRQVSVAFRSGQRLVPARSQVALGPRNPRPGGVTVGLPPWCALRAPDRVEGQVDVRQQPSLAGIGRRSRRRYRRRGGLRGSHRIRRPCPRANLRCLHPSPSPSPWHRPRSPLPRPAAAPAAGASPISRPWCPPAPATVAAAPAPPLPRAGACRLRHPNEFFRDKGRHARTAESARDFRALSITPPMPTGWSQVPDPERPDAFAVIADRNGGDGLYTSNAQVVVYKLVGDFDPREAITHGFIDSQQLAGWQTTDGSLSASRRIPVVGHRGRLPPERHGAQHVPAARHRDRRPGPLPGDAVGDHRRQPGSGGRPGDGRDRQRVPVAAPAAPVAPAAAPAPATPAVPVAPGHPQRRRRSRSISPAPVVRLAQCRSPECCVWWSPRCCPPRLWSPLRTWDRSAQDLRWQARRSPGPDATRRRRDAGRGSLLALIAGGHALPLVLVAAAGAVGTVAVGAWQAGRHAVEQADAASACSPSPGLAEPHRSPNPATARAVAAAAHSSN